MRYIENKVVEELKKDGWEFDNNVDYLLVYDTIKIHKRLILKKIVNTQSILYAGFGLLVGSLMIYLYINII